MMDAGRSIRLAELEAANGLAKALLALNNTYAAELSWLDVDRLRQLVSQAAFAKHIGLVDALLIALDQDSAYDSPNFQWFRARYRRFIYVDRVVVAASARGLGLARQLYRELFAEALAAHHSLVLCEVNADPPNPASDAFHASLGFRPVGSARLDGDMKKTVTYLARPLASALDKASASKRRD
jgi:uncharacterized protein